MAKLYSSRFKLNQVWLKTIGSKERKTNSAEILIKCLSLRHSLSFVINCFNHYFKVIIVEHHFQH